MKPIELNFGRQTVTIKPNIVDKVVNYFDPQAAARRLDARVRMEIVSGYNGASKTSRTFLNWRTDGASANAIISQDLTTIRDRSCELIRNNPVASGAVDDAVTNVVGSGLKLQSSINRKILNLSEEAADEWQNLAETEFALFLKYCDYSRISDFYDLQDIVLRGTLGSGDIFSNLPRDTSNPMTPYSLKIQMIEAHRVTNNSYGRDSKTLNSGVEVDDFGAPRYYHVMKSHPGDATIDRTRWEWDIIPAYNNFGYKNILHHYKMLRPGQSRGIPWLAPVIEPLKQLGRYTDAELMAAVVSGMLTVFITTPLGDGNITGMGTSPATAAPTAKYSDNIELGNGNVVGLQPGEEILTTTPGRPNVAFDPFFAAILKQVGVGLGIPFEVLLKYFSSSYSAARGAMLEAWKFYINRRVWLAKSFCQPVYELFLAEAVMLGRLPAPGFFNDPLIRLAYCGEAEQQWIGSAQPQIDPQKEVRAAKERVAEGFSTRQEETRALTGGDWEQKHVQSVKEKRMRIEGGLEVEAGAENNKKGNV